MNKNKHRCPKCKSMNLIKNISITGCGKNQKGIFCLNCHHTFNIKNIVAPKEVN